MNVRSKKYILAIIGIISIFILIFSMTIYANHQPGDDQYISTTGTIKYISLEGGFYGIIGDNGQGYDPINLPVDFQIDGLNVFFTALKRYDLASIHMLGIIIEIIDINLV